MHGVDVLSVEGRVWEGLEGKIAEPEAAGGTFGSEERDLIWHEEGEAALDAPSNENTAQRADGGLGYCPQTQLGGDESDRCPRAYSYVVVGSKTAASDSKYIIHVFRFRSAEEGRIYEQELASVPL